MTGPKVIALAAPHAPNPELVRMLEDLLADAKAGTLCAVHGVAEYHNQHVDYLHAGDICDFTTAGYLQALILQVLTDED